MTNNEKINKAEELMAEATKLLNEVKETTEEEDDDDVVAKYKKFLNDLSNKYSLDAFSDIDCNYCNYSSMSYPTENLKNPYMYYASKALAMQALTIKNFNDKLLAFKYCYDDDFVPDWNDSDTEKWSVYFDAGDNRYCYTASYNCYYPNVIYFSCEIVAKECCRWLNSLKED